MKFFVISDNNDTLEGMRLAGIEGEIVTEKRDVQASVARCIADPKTLVVEIPNRNGTSRGPDSITHYIREAIGIKI